MTIIQRSLKISSVRAVGEMIYLDLIPTESPLTTQPTKIPRPEDVIELKSKSETEKLGRELTRGMIDEFKRSGMPAPTDISVRLPTQPLLSLALSINEYEKLGRPTPLDGITIKIGVA